MAGLMLLGFGVTAVAYGLKGERIPGKIITIIGATSDNGLRVSERVFWVAAGVGATVLAFLGSVADISP